MIHLGETVTAGPAHGIDIADHIAFA